ncbi:MAG: hypothetical protein ACHQX4_05400 [Gemmatimonadales bacterium]
MLHSNDTILTLTAQLPNRAFLVVLACLASSACGNNSARAPNPTAYRWPEALAYRVEPGGGGEPRTLRFQVRDAQFFVSTDSLAAGRLAPADADTTSFFVSIGRRGELTRLELACDPAVAACAAELPSRLATLLRRLIPRLPLWEAPRGGSWDDTLRFDDTARPGGSRGELITRYTGRGDTVIGGRGFWVIVWRSESTPGPVRQEGVSLVDKDRLLPVFSMWSAVVAPPPEASAAGATATGYRGRGYLTGSVFDSLYSREIAH